MPKGEYTYDFIWQLQIKKQIINYKKLCLFWSFFFFRSMPWILRQLI